MTNSYFEPGERRAEKVSDLFAAVARRYDFINDLQSFGWHRLWKRRLVRLAGPGPGKKALDVCCGTGDVAFLLSKGGAGVTGLDFSSPMLEVARRRGGSAGGAVRIPDFVQGDALRLPFLAGTFDIVTVSYGLRNLSSWQDGLDELWRVTAPGGRLLALDFGKPDNPAWRALYFAYLRWVVPWFGRLFCGDSETHAYILESLRHYPAQKGVHRRLVELGADDASIVNLFGGVMSINFARKPELAS